MDITTSSRIENQRVVIALSGHSDYSVDIRYEPEKHSLRVLQGDARRLFFYESDSFFPSRGTLINEYGLEMCKLQMRSGTKGLIQFNDVRVSLLLNPVEGWVELQHPGLQDPVYWHYDSAATEGIIKQDPNLFRALLLTLAWSVGVPALQA